MSKHTPGPWNREAIRCLLWFGLSNHGPWDDLYDDTLQMPDYYDDHLIAAAPELLEALEKMVGLFEPGRIYEFKEIAALGSEALKIALAAIAKAKGEG